MSLALKLCKSNQNYVEQVHFCYESYFWYDCMSHTYDSYLFIKEKSDVCSCTENCNQVTAEFKYHTMTGMALNLNSQIADFGHINVAAKSSGDRLSLESVKNFDQNQALKLKLKR